MQLLKDFCWIRTASDFEYLRDSMTPIFISMPKKGGWGGCLSSSPLNFVSQMFLKGPLFGIILRESFLAGQRQNFSKGAFEANIKKIEG